MLPPLAREGALSEGATRDLLEKPEERPDNDDMPPPPPPYEREEKAEPPMRPPLRAASAGLTVLSAWHVEVRSRLAS